MFQSPLFYSLMNHVYQQKTVDLANHIILDLLLETNVLSRWVTKKQSTVMIIIQTSIYLIVLIENYL